jgi:hypothetical protein
LIDEAEMQRLAAASGLRIHELFHAGGREGNLSLFAVMGRPALGTALHKEHSVQ